MTLTLRIALSLGVAAIGPFSAAVAADYDPIVIEEAEEYVPVEVGSGWYLRGDVAYNFKRSFKDTSISIDEPALIDPFLDLGPLSPMQDVFYSEKDTPIQGSIGFGYHFNEFLRADLNVGQFGDTKYNFSGVIPNDITPDTGCSSNLTVSETPVDIDGNETGPAVVSGPSPATMDCLASGSVKNSAFSGMANAYVDLGTYVGITPYIGGGLGVYYSQSKVNASANCSSYDVVTTEGGTRTTEAYDCVGGDGNVASASYNDKSWNLLYTLNAGLAYKVSKNTSVDFGYQYMAAPDARYYSVGSQGIESHKGIDYHQVKIGLRYDLW